jgi:hypothetical protein
VRETDILLGIRGSAVCVERRKYGVDRGKGGDYLKALPIDIINYHLAYLR